MAASSPYGRDPFSQLNRLLDAHHTAPGSIRKTCLAVEECLANNRDNLRGFFDKPFANLLKRVFGYGDFEASWLNIVTKGRDADARALVNLLAPDGKLFAAMAQADNDRLVQYIFPTERLPAHTQELLKEPQGLGRRVLDTWPQYRGRIRNDAAGRPQVYLNLFEYFMFWTAFYVLRGSASESGRADMRTMLSSSPSSMMYGMNGIRSVGSAIVGNLIMGRPAGVLQGHPYYCLLKTYLEYFLPRSVRPGRGGGPDGAAVSRAIPTVGAVAGVSTASVVTGLSSIPYSLGLADGASGGTAVGWASYKPTLTAAAAGPESRGAVLLSILVEFWLTDPAEPLPSLVPDRVNGVVQPTAGGPIAGLGIVGAGMVGVAGSPGGVMGLTGTASPTPVAVTTPPSVRMLTYQPPSAELVEGLVALVRYVYVIEQEPGGATEGPSGGAGTNGFPGVRDAAGIISSGSGGGGIFPSGGASGRGTPTPLQPAQVGRSPWLPETPVKTPPPPPPRLLVPPTVLLVQGNSASAAVQAISRKVYRQLRRAFALWPPSSSTSMTPLISLWLSAIAPWCPSYAHTRKAAATDAASGGGNPVGGGGAAAVTGNGSSGPSGTSGAAAHLNHNDHHSALHSLDGARALGSAAAAAAGVVEATAAKLHLGTGLGRERDKDRDMAGTTSREVLAQYQYTTAWRSHVLAHLPFYLVLLPQFVSLSLSRLKYRPDSALRDLDRVLAVLTAAGPELLRELRAAEVIYNDYARPAAAGGRRRSEGEYGEMVPWWLEQVQDFEAAAAAGSSAPGPLVPDLQGRLFTTDTASAAYTACLLLRSAETLGRPELVAALRQSAGAVLPLGSILPASVAEQRGGEAAEGPFCAADAKRLPRAGRWSSLRLFLIQQNPKLADPHALWTFMYSGPDGRHDPMFRPIASNEVAWLVRPLVRASTRVNAALGLDVPYRPGEEEEDPPEHLGQQALLWARKRGHRVNLRLLAEIQTILWLLGLVLLGYAIAKAFTGGGDGGGGSGPAAGSTTGGAQLNHGAGAGYNMYSQDPYSRSHYSHYSGGQGQAQYHYEPAMQRLYGDAGDATMGKWQDSYQGEDSMSPPMRSEMDDEASPPQQGYSFMA